MSVKSMAASEDADVRTVDTQNPVRNRSVYSPRKAMLLASTPAGVSKNSAAVACAIIDVVARLPAGLDVDLDPPAVGMVESLRHPTLRERTGCRREAP